MVSSKRREQSQLKQLGLSSAPDSIVKTWVSCSNAVARGETAQLQLQSQGNEDSFGSPQSGRELDEKHCRNE